MKLNGSLALGGLIFAVLGIMIIPIPAFLIDLGLVFSFGLSLVVFLLVLVIKEPIEFSSFPSLLLTAVIIRLSLNIASTKLIISEGHTGPQAAGDVIFGFSSFVMSGSIVIGIVIFLILLFVNFTVITKGAGRMAEVGARFALDGMPGRQLAIDSDLASGAISQDEAQEMRKKVQQEASFFGSLDGASKFVKGDAIAGLVITALNLFVGLGVGVLSHGMSFGSAAENYTLLAVGDGLVTQFPAVLVSIAAALMVAKDRSSSSLGDQVVDQLMSSPFSLYLPGAVLLLLSLAPVFPSFGFVILGGALLLAGFIASRSEKDAENQDSEEEQIAATDDTSISNMFDVDDVKIGFSMELVPLFASNSDLIREKVLNLRRFVVREFGVLIPDIRFCDDAALPPGEYYISIFNVKKASGNIRVDRLLAIPGDRRFALGDETVEPVYGVPARWIGFDQREAAEFEGVSVVEPAEVLVTHLLETIKKNLTLLLTKRAVRRMLDELTNVPNSETAAENRRLVEEINADAAAFETFHRTLRALLDEGVSIRNIALIIEAVLEASSLKLNFDEGYELVRQRLAFQIVSSLVDQDGSIKVHRLSSQIEARLNNVNGEFGANGAGGLHPEFIESLSSSINEHFGKFNADSDGFVLVSSSRCRRLLSMLMRNINPLISVISFDELGTDRPVSLVGTIG